MTPLFWLPADPAPRPIERAKADLLRTFDPRTDDEGRLGLRLGNLIAAAAYGARGEKRV